MVDDEPTVLNFCKLILSRGGYHVIEAKNAIEALSLARSSKPVHLALLDVVMPGMNGVELAKQLRQMEPKPEILLMSGYSVNEVRNIAGGDCPFRLVWKPFKADPLLRMIQTVLDAAPRDKKIPPSS